MDERAAFDAIVLAGGSASRLDGAAKPQLKVGGASLLDHVLAAVGEATRRVVVGPAQAVATPVVWACEEPAGGGPAAGLGAALPLTAEDTVLVLAADLPWVAPAVPVLRSVLSDAPSSTAAAALVDTGGRINHLAAAWRRPALVAALAGAGNLQDLPMHRLVAGLDIAAVSDQYDWGTDCDTWDDLAAARARSGAHT